ncbi:MAG: 16S rRNA (guanine(527)-N(7))-methyltransferase RsmG [Pikeienuella sp.]
MTDLILVNGTSLNVSRETHERLEVYEQRLRHWNRSINLVAPSTLQDLWTRHIVDSAQLLDLAPKANTWVDLGAGGGLPGLIIAAILHETSPETKVTMIESDKRKSAFLSDAAHHMGISVKVLPVRIEAAPKAQFDVISARALAPLPKLLELAAPFCNENTVCLFPKGETVEQELTTARSHWHIDAETFPSCTHTGATILKIQGFSRA